MSLRHTVATIKNAAEMMERANPMVTPAIAAIKGIGSIYKDLPHTSLRVASVVDNMIVQANAVVAGNSSLLGFLRDEKANGLNKNIFNEFTLGRYGLFMSNQVRYALMQAAHPTKAPLTGASSLEAMRLI